MSIKLVVTKPESITCEFKKLSGGELFTTYKDFDIIYLKFSTEPRNKYNAVCVPFGEPQIIDNNQMVTRLEGTLTVQTMNKFPDKE